jgi:hypothetical protein
LAFETDANAAFHTNRFETDANTVLASVWNRGVETFLKLGSLFIDVVCRCRVLASVSNRGVETFLELGSLFVAQ